MIDWIDIKDKKPKRGERVLVFSPCYMHRDQGKVDGMAYRIIDEQFLHLLDEATHWAYLSPPTGEHNDDL